MPTFKTDSEALFDEYLQRSGVEREYELPLGSRKPDFWLNPPDHDIVCEVTEVERYLAESGSYDGAQPLRNKVSKKATQGADAPQSDLAFVIVIEPGLWPVHSIDVIRSMFGNRQFTDSGALVGGSESPSGVLSTNRKTAVSAVAILSTVHPAQQALDERVDSIPHDGSIAGIVQAAFAAKRLLDESGVDWAERTILLDVFHNPFAACAVPQGAFRGSNDAHWHPDQSDARPIWVGSNRTEGFYP